MVAGESVLVPEALEDLLRRVALLAVIPLIVLEDPVDDAGERIELRTPRRTAPPVARRHRERQLLGDRLAVDPEPAGRFPSAQTLTMTRQSDTPIKIHSVHPPAFHQVNPDEGYRRSHMGPPQPDNPAASMGDYCAAVLSKKLKI